MDYELRGTSIRNIEARRSIRDHFETASGKVPGLPGGEALISSAAARRIIHSLWLTVDKLVEHNLEPTQGQAADEPGTGLDGWIDDQVEPDAEPEVPTEPSAEQEGFVDWKETVREAQKESIREAQVADLQAQLKRVLEETRKAIEGARQTQEERAAQVKLIEESVRISRITAEATEKIADALNSKAYDRFASTAFAALMQGAMKFDEGGVLGQETSLFASALCEGWGSDSSVLSDEGTVSKAEMMALDAYYLAEMMMKQRAKGIAPTAVDTLSSKAGITPEELEKAASANLKAGMRVAFDRITEMVESSMNAEIKADKYTEGTVRHFYQGFSCLIGTARMILGPNQPEH